ncbi:MAG: AraC family transcriptional regulator, partial [Planctomycetota bacterium]
DVADAFRRQDDEVVTYGRSISGQVCSVPHAAGYLKWYVETKVALTEASGRPVGVAGVMYDLDRAGAILEPYQRLETAIRHIGDNYRESISIDELAALSHLSVSQFKRVFKDLFGISPHRYLTRVRLQAVRRLLLETTKTVDVIAAETGFFDASHLTRNFKKEVEMTPHAFRKQRHS